MTNRVYDTLKWFCLIVMPALSTLVSVISRIWGWADLGSLIAQTITAVAVFLGAVLGISNYKYKNDSFCV